MHQSNAEQWSIVYAAYHAAHGEYLQLKLARQAAPPEMHLDGPLSTGDTHSRFVAAKLVHAHRDMLDFLETHPAVIVESRAQAAQARSDQRLAAA